MARINLKGIEELKKDERFQLNKIVNSYYDKIVRSLGDGEDLELNIKIKVYQKSGKGKIEENSHKKKKYSVQIQVKNSIKNLDSSASDWDLNRTMHAALKKVLEEIEHRFHISEQRK